jgi:hypothetical protein
VSRLDDPDRYGLDGGANMAPLQPAVLRQHKNGDMDIQVPWSVVGRIAHRALQDWTCLELPAPALERRLASYAHREGMLASQAASLAAGRALRMLSDLKRTPLYTQITSAPERYTGLAFTLDTPGGLLEGTIDMLYRDALGKWRLVEWKTAWAGKAYLEEDAQKHRLRMAHYAEAARRATGETPVASICFLAARAALYTFPSEALAAQR